MAKQSNKEPKNSTKFVTGPGLKHNITVEHHVEEKGVVKISREDFATLWGFAGFELVAFQTLDQIELTFVKR